MKFKINNRVIEMYMNVDDEAEEYLTKVLTEYPALKEENEELKRHVKRLDKSIKDYQKIIQDKVEQLRQQRDELAKILKLSVAELKWLLEISDENINTAIVTDAEELLQKVKE